MKIYTKTGDQGNTGLFGGQRVPKNDPRIIAYGTVDQTNAHIGLAIAQSPHKTLNTTLYTLQALLFSLGADLATPLKAQAPAAKIIRITNQDVQTLETLIDQTTQHLTPQKTFILPGGSITAAQLHIARTTARQAEIQTITLSQNQDINTHSLVFLNRLSDLLFTLARYANTLDHQKDIPWQPDSP